MAQARMSSGGRIVIPKAVRQKLGLQTGDLIRFEVGEEGRLAIDKVRRPEDIAFASFDEWSSEDDETLYGGL